MESMSDLASALTERTAEADSILALPPVVVSHVLAFCDWREFDTLGQLNRCGKSKCSSTDIPGQSYSKFCVCVCVCVCVRSSRQRTQATHHLFVFTVVCCCNYRAWQAELQLEHHYKDRVITRELDWTLKLGQQRLDMLTRQFGHRRVFINLSGMSCGICGRHTRGFSWLACSRVCKKCYKESPHATVYSVSDALV
jgi:hypothetical protein